MMWFRKSTGRGRTLGRQSLTGTLLIALTALAQQALAASSVTCTVNPNPLNFGSYNTTSDLGMPMTVTISCGGWGQTNSVSYTLSATAGSGSYSGRQMPNGSNTIVYNLYTTSGDTTIWGDGTSGTITLTGTVTKQTSTVNVTIYGLIRGGQNVVPGGYATTTPITVSLAYTF
jgi:spore coat protein U-like protein